MILDAGATQVWNQNVRPSGPCAPDCKRPQWPDDPHPQELRTETGSRNREGTVPYPWLHLRSRVEESPGRDGLVYRMEPRSCFLRIPQILLFSIVPPERPNRLHCCSSHSSDPY